LNSALYILYVPPTSEREFGLLLGPAFSFSI